MRADHSSYAERVRAVKSYLEGGSVEAIASNLGRHKASVYKWIKIYEKKKRYEDLDDKPRSGRPLKITEKVINKIEKDLQKPASKFGFETDLWTCGRVHSLLSKKYKIKISRGHVWTILKKSGFSYQKLREKIL